MTSAAFLVDGDLEKRFISEICKGSPIRKIGNGDNFPVHVIAKHVMTQVKLLSNRVQYIILLLDLEDRSISPGQFATDILSALKAAGLGTQSITIVIKEREVEDWILADPRCIADFVGSPVNVAGRHGKGGLARLLKDHNIKYNEVTIGCDLLKGVYCSHAVHNSPSLNYAKTAFPLNCWWLNR